MTSNTFSIIRISLKNVVNIELKTTGIDNCFVQLIMLPTVMAVRRLWDNETTKLRSPQKFDKFDSSAVRFNMK